MPTLADRASYTVVVSNSFGSATSAPASLTVTVPIITLQDAPIGITNSPLTSTSISQPFSVTAGANVLVVTLLEKTSVAAGITPAALSWNGQTLTCAVRTIDTGSIYREAAIYYIYNPTPGTANITGTLGGTPVCTYLQAYSLSRVNTNLIPVTGMANSTSGTSSYLTFTANVAANSWAAVGGVLGAKNVAGVAVSGTGGDASGVFLGNDTSADNCEFAFGYISGLSGGLDTFAYSWTLPGNLNPTANAFVGAIFAPQLLTPHLSPVSLSAATPGISATNGTPGGAWMLLQSTNLTLPLNQWQVNATGSFDSGGNLSTNIGNIETNHQEFYILKVQ
jgi:hypothetical protein